MHGDEIRVLQFGEHLAFANGLGAIENFQGNIAVEPVARVIDITEGSVAELLNDVELSPPLSRFQRFGEGSRSLQRHCFIRNLPA